MYRPFQAASNRRLIPGLTYAFNQFPYPIVNPAVPYYPVFTYNQLVNVNFRPQTAQVWSPVSLAMSQYDRGKRPRTNSGSSTESMPVTWDRRFIADSKRRMQEGELRPRSAEPRTSAHSKRIGNEDSNRTYAEEFPELGAESGFKGHSSGSHFPWGSKKSSATHASSQNYSARSGRSSAETETSSERIAKQQKYDKESKKRIFIRNWVKTDNDPSGTSESMAKGVEFSVMTYNILSQDLIGDNEYLYSTVVNEDNLTWNIRRKKILKEISTHSPDILCLQEAQKDHYDNFLGPTLKSLGYDTMYKKRTGTKPDGCVLAFKRSKFVLENSSSVEYFQGQNCVMDRDNVGIVAVLIARERPVRLCVATTHILFNMKRGDVKLGQVCMLLAEIDKMMGSDRCPLILCGDFNCHPFSPLYNFVTFGHLPYEGMFADHIARVPDYPSKRPRVLEKGELPPAGISENCKYNAESGNTKITSEVSKKINSFWQQRADSDPPISGIIPDKNGCATKENPTAELSGNLTHDFKMVSSYKHLTQRGEKFFPEVTTHHCRANDTVDYLFYSVESRKSRVTSHGILTPSDVVENDLNLLERLDLATHRDAERAGCFPNDQFGSDHLSLMCKFLLRVPEKSKI